MIYRSHKSEGPTAGTETVDPLEFLARVLVQIHDKGHVTTRYYRWYANRSRGMREKAAPAAADGRPAIVPAPEQIFQVDPLACPTCRGAMRIVALVTRASVIGQILTHLRTRALRTPGCGARHRRGTPRAGARHKFRAPAAAPPAT